MGNVDAFTSLLSQSVLAHNAEEIAGYRSLCMCCVVTVSIQRQMRNLKSSRLYSAQLRAISHRSYKLGPWDVGSMPVNVICIPSRWRDHAQDTEGIQTSRFLHVGSSLRLRSSHEQLLFWQFRPRNATQRRLQVWMGFPVFNSMNSSVFICAQRYRCWHQCRR